MCSLVPAALLRIVSVGKKREKPKPQRRLTHSNNCCFSLRRVTFPLTLVLLFLSGASGVNLGHSGIRAFRGENLSVDIRMCCFLSSQLRSIYSQANMAFGSRHPPIPPRRRHVDSVFVVEHALFLERKQARKSNLAPPYTSSSCSRIHTWGI